MIITDAGRNTIAEIYNKKDSTVTRPSTQWGCTLERAWLDDPTLRTVVMSYCLHPHSISAAQSHRLRWLVSAKLLLKYLHPLMTHHFLLTAIEHSRAAGHVSLRMRIDSIMQCAYRNAAV